MNGCAFHFLIRIVLLLSLLGATTLAAETASKGELLYNGIRLPRAWPPRDEVKAESREPMPVPYLEAPPEVVPIDVGRQLFMDDFLIAKSTLRRTFHHAQKYEGNPVLKPETPSEVHGEFVHGANDPTATACPFDDGVFYDPQDQLFKMWYMGGFYRHTCLATSADGLHWARPNFDVQPGTNVVIPYRDEFMRDAFSPWLDWNAASPAEKWKAFIYARSHAPTEPKGHSASYLYTSPDGIHWSERATVKAGDVGDNSTIFYNPFRKKWVMSVRRNVKERIRSRFYFESDTFTGLADMKTTDPVFWFGADDLDPPDAQTQHAPQLYCLSPVGYESIMLGAFAIHYGPENKDCDKGKFPKLTEIELGYSRDGFHFSRPDRTSFIAATKREGDSDRGYIRPAGSVCNIVGDRLYFYYSAFSGVAPDGQKHFYAGGSTHVAFLRRDGFASMDSDAAGGELTTRSVTFKGAHLFVNAAAAQGELRAEILDDKGRTIEPFTAQNCIPVTGDKTLLAVKWKGADDLSVLSGRAVHFRFHLKNGSLYAFWVSPESSGASHGYVAAGGPGFTGPTDTPSSASPSTTATAAPGADLRLTYQSSAGSSEQPYRLYVPTVYDGKRPLPLIVLLHGTGGDENTMFDGYDNGATKRAAEKAGVLLVSPRGDLASEYRGRGEHDVLSVLQEVRRDYSVDETRIYLTGHSMGATGSAYLALHHPDIFAAAAPLAAAYSYPWLARNARHVPMLWIGGSNDTEAYLRGVMPGIERMLKFGAQITLELLPGEGHRGPVKDFDRIFEWLLKRQREPHPKSYSFDVDTPLHGHAFWTTVEKLSEPGEVAELDAEVAEGNIARFKMNNVAAFSFAPDPAVFDANDEIGIVINGEESWRGKIAEDEELALQFDSKKWTASPRKSILRLLTAWRAHPVADAAEELTMLGTEKRLANWITDAMREATGADVALYSPVYYRGLPIPKGTVDIVDVIQCTRPFDQNLVTVDLSGREIARVLSANLATLEKYPVLSVDRPGAGRLVQVSGMRYVFDSSKVATGRLVSTDLDMDRVYTVALEGQVVERETMALGGHFKRLDYQTTDTPLSLALYTHAVKTGHISAKVEGRVVDQNSKPSS